MSNFLQAFTSLRALDYFEFFTLFAGVVILVAVGIRASKTRTHQSKKEKKPAFPLKPVSELLLPAVAALFLAWRYATGTQTMPITAELGIMLAVIVLCAVLHIPTKHADDMLEKEGEPQCEKSPRKSDEAENREENPLRAWLPTATLLLLTALTLFLLDQNFSLMGKSIFALLSTDPLSFTNYRFFLFAACTALFYYLVPKRAQWVVAMLASIVFYSTYGRKRMVFIFAASLIAYFAARKMDRLQREIENKAEAKKKCKPILLLAFAGLISMLLYAKIGTWVMQTVGTALRIGGAETAKAIVALGISYYTFSLISYLADVYWRKDTAETNYLHLLAFTIYFPKILQGPISRHKELAPQFFEEHRFDYEKFCFGVQRMLWGYFKKLVIADRLAIFVNTVFGNVEGESGAHLLVAAVFGAVQSYCDFSGCMDIACGFSECLGLKLAENFDHPFFSRSAAEFWRRWHITLGTWLKNYIYMPLVISPGLIKMSKRVKERFGAQAAKNMMAAIPLLITWLITAVWHGTTPNYLVWGLYWYILITASTVFASEYKKLATVLRINTETGSWRLFQMVRTFVLFMVCHVMIISKDLPSLWLFFKRVFTEFHIEGFFNGSLYTLGLDRPNFLLGIVSIFALWSVSMLQRSGSVRERIAGSNLVFRWTMYYVLFFSIIIFGIYGPGYNTASFVYMQY